MTGAEVRKRPARAALGNRQLMQLVAVIGASAISEWALWVGVLVYAFERGGPTTAGVAAVALLIPAAVAAPTAGVAADGDRPIRVLLIVFVVQTVLLAAAAALIAAEAPFAVVISFAAVVIAAISFVRPSFAVIVPGVVTSAGDLVAANSFVGVSDNCSVLAGPLLASGVLAVGGTAWTLAACGVVCGFCGFVTMLVERSNSRRGLAGLGVLDDGSLPTRRLGIVVRQRRAVSHLFGTLAAMWSVANTRSLLVVLGAQSALVGALDLLYVNIAFDVLDLGGSGPGLLSAAFGVGAVLGAVLSALFIARRRLAPPMIASILGIAIAMVLLGAVPALAVTLVALPVAGISRAVLDMSARSLLQRSAPQHLLASVFATVEMLAGGGILFGSLLVQLLVAVSGAQTAAVGVGVFFVVVGALTARSLRHADDDADAPVVEIRLLRSIPLFAPLPGPALEAVARAAETLHYAPDEHLVREGEIGDRYFVIADGRVAVSIAGTLVRTMGRGEAFGEIALLADAPRTATVIALEPTTVLGIGRTTFLGAVVGHAAAARVAWAVARSLHPPLRSSDQV